MNKAGIIAVIALSAGALTVTGIKVYNRYFRVNESVVETFINADPVITAMSVTDRATVISYLKKEINRILLNIEDVRMINFVATQEKIFFETQLVITAKARLIADGYLTVSGEINNA